MILEQLNRICHEIRVLEMAYEIPPGVTIEAELRDKINANKLDREEHLAKQLYGCVKKYALDTMRQNRENYES